MNAVRFAWTILTFIILLVIVTVFFLAAEFGSAIYEV
jgi:hypothetical protein